MYGTVPFEILSYPWNLNHHFNLKKKSFFVSITKQKLEQIMITIASDIHLMNWSAFDVEIWSSAFLIWHNLWDKIDNFAISCQLIHLVLLDFDFWYYLHRIKIFDHIRNQFYMFKTKMISQSLRFIPSSSWNWNFN